MIKLNRASEKPILQANKNNEWEQAAVFNVAAIADNGLVHMLYRSTNKNSNGRECDDYLNYFGYAVSSDGINFSRLDTPILGPIKDSQEERGVEDARIVKIDDIFYMLYTGYGGRFDGDFRICLATSKNLITWQRHGIVLDEPNKDASYFPRKINGKYYLLHRRAPHIWICESNDMKTWENHKILLQVKEDNPWENHKIGLAGPPIETEKGWILIYHGVSQEHQDNCGNGTYALGIAGLAKEDPTTVIYRQKEPILVPELEWEKNGFVKNVVFSNGQAVVDGILYVYYGGADTATGVASINLQTLQDELFS
ncbi:glycoside hydrolase family 130 protein [Psychromonas ossibalaenae]|uniref:glycoside hydrolase family 130 protein n=1 Tax=Psychromonas ossibalaenae TaxID=444922 RepID=UPI00037E283B|nr:hypothetical protein [Psychromonas ossibalaenae]